MNIVMKEVVKYIPAISSMGLYPPSVETSEPEIHSETPVFCSATDIGIIAAMSTMLSQLIVLYAASTLRKQPVSTISRPAIITAVTGAMGMKSNTMTAIIASMIIAATGAL